MGAAAGGRMIMPGPARRHVNLESDLAAQALAGGRFAKRDGFGFFLCGLLFVEHGGPLINRRHSGARVA